MDFLWNSTVDFGPQQAYSDPFFSAWLNCPLLWTKEENFTHVCVEWTSTTIIIVKNEQNEILQIFSVEKGPRTFSFGCKKRRR